MSRLGLPAVLADVALDLAPTVVFFLACGTKKEITPEIESGIKKTPTKRQRHPLVPTVCDALGRDDNGGDDVMSERNL